MCAAAEPSRSPQSVENSPASGEDPLLSLEKTEQLLSKFMADL